MEYKKENGTLILGSVEEMRMFANGHITINHDNVKHLVYNGTPLPLGYRCALEFIMLDLNNLKDITIKNDQNFINLLMVLSIHKMVKSLYFVQMGQPEKL